MIGTNAGHNLREDMILEVNNIKHRDDLKLKRKEWELVLQIDGNRTIQEIFGLIDLEKDEILAVLYNLFQKNLIKVKNHADKIYVDSEFFEKLEKILTEFIGPVAPFVIDEMLVELNEDRSGFDGEKLPLLAEMISRTIDDDTKRVNYQRVILEQLQRS
jgi:hypothetical protein